MIHRSTNLHIAQAKVENKDTRDYIFIQVVKFGQRVVSQQAFLRSYNIVLLHFDH